MTRFCSAFLCSFLYYHASVQTFCQFQLAWSHKCSDRTVAGWPRQWCGVKIQVLQTTYLALNFNTQMQMRFVFVLSLLDHRYVLRDTLHNMARFHRLISPNLVLVESWVHKLFKKCMLNKVQRVSSYEAYWDVMWIFVCKRWPVNCQVPSAYKHYAWVHAIVVRPAEKGTLSKVYDCKCTKYSAISAGICFLADPNALLALQWCCINTDQIWWLQNVSSHRDHWKYRQPDGLRSNHSAGGGTGVGSDFPLRRPQLDLWSDRIARHNLCSQHRATDFVQNGKLSIRYTHQYWQSALAIAKKKKKETQLCSFAYDRLFFLQPSFLQAQPNQK